MPDRPYPVPSRPNPAHVEDDIGVGGRAVLALVIAASLSLMAAGVWSVARYNVPTRHPAQVCTTDR